MWLDITTVLSAFTPSDYLLVGSVVPAIWFVLVYGGATKWWVDPLGWIVLAYGLAVAGLLGLIVYGIFNGQRVDEVLRFIFSAFLFVALCGKVIVLHLERRRGRLEKRRASHPQKENAHAPR